MAQADCLPVETGRIEDFGSGDSVAMEGNLAVTGAMRDNENGDGAGAAFVYRYDGQLNEWIEEAKLLPADPIEDGEFGIAVAIQNGTAFVGSDRGRGARYDRSGSVYIFRKQDGAWTQHQKLVAADEDASDWFGRSLAVHGQVLVVGSQFDDDGPNSGAAYVFRFDGNSWVEEAELWPSNGDVRAEFGTSVAMHGPLVVVGAPNQREGIDGSGGAYVYRFNGSEWVEEAALRAADPAPVDRFGISVAVAQDTIVVGSYLADIEEHDNAGAAYVFEYEDGAWLQSEKITAVDREADDRFGAGVAIRGDMMVIGAMRDDDNGNDFGSAYLYERDGEAWQLQAKLRASEQFNGGSFGSAVALVDSGAIIGAPFAFLGRAYIYQGIEEDCNANDAVDLCDITNGLSEDCNANHVPDECDIESGRSRDENENGVPDECEGACCLPDEGCRDSVHINDCEAGRFLPGVACKDLDPPCGTIGACCAPDGVCNDDVSEMDCPDRFVPEISCAEISPPCVAVGACCAIGGTCEDDVPMDACDGRFVIQGTCADIDPPCLEICEDAELQRLLDEEGEASDLFGVALDMEGDLALIGALGDDEAGSGAGTVHTFRFDGASWVFEGQLFGSDTDRFDRFGAAVDMDGVTAVIGAYSAGTNGAAYVFRYDANEAAWIEEAILHAEDGESSDWFGGDVAISGDLVIVGAERDDDNGGNAGSAYVFRHSEGNWLQEAKLLPDDGEAGDFFGAASALDGNRAMIAAPFNDDSGSSSGSVYVFEFDGESWVQTAKLTAADGRAGDRFGGEISLQRDTAAIGAVGDDDSSGSGAVYIYHYDGAQWRQEIELHGPHGRSAGFGYSVDLSSDWLAVGTLAGTSERGIDSAHLFERVGDSWRQRFAWTPADPSTGESSGMSVAVWDGVILAGAHNWGTERERQGAAYVFGAADCNANGTEDACESMAEGDYDADGDVDIDDHFHLFECLQGPGVPPEPADAMCVRACLSAFDLDADNDVDLADASAFQIRFGG